MIDVELFAGAGGATIGLQSVGVDPVCFESDADACATARAACHRVVRADIADYPWPHHLRGRVRLLHASPPCQPFSAAGDGAGEDDPRDGMPWTLRAIDELRPRLVTIENVPGLLRAKHRRYFGAFITRLAGLGYQVEYRVLNAADFGVPQTRKRVIIVARVDGTGHVRWPRPTHAEGGRGGRLPWVTMAEALGWGIVDRPFPTVAGANFTGGFDPWGVDGSGARAILRAARDEGRFQLNTGLNWDREAGRAGAQTRTLDRPAPTVSSKSGTGQWHWVHERPATTSAGDTRVHPPSHKINADDIAKGRTGHDRAGTDAIRVDLDELAVLQGFPPGYPFRGNRTSIARQIGNALPPALIAAVVRANLAEQEIAA